MSNHFQKRPIHQNFHIESLKSIKSQLIESSSSNYFQKGDLIKLVSEKGHLIKLVSEMAN